MTDTRFIDAAEERARQFLEEGSIESFKVELMAQDILNLVSDLRAHRRMRSAVLQALAESVADRPA